MYPASCSLVKISCATSWWFSVCVDVNRSKLMPSLSQLSKNSAWYCPKTSSGETPRFSASRVTGVPCESLPDTIRTSLPFSLWYRANMSAGT